jgi:tRNA uridine 5-carboxymethylaminomethyl modification enzyme
VETEVEIKYEGYIDRQLKEIVKLKELERMKIPVGLNFAGIQGLSNELKCRLEEIRPATLGQAERIEGMTPAGLQAVQLAVKMRKDGKGNL